VVTSRSISMEEVASPLTSTVNTWWLLLVRKYWTR
jgi:hypothetical protein